MAVEHKRAVMRRWKVWENAGKAEKRGNGGQLAISPKC